eukprot:5483473-Prymnesium_polylepis.1
MRCCVSSLTRHSGQTRASVRSCRARHEPSPTATRRRAPTPAEAEHAVPCMTGPDVDSLAPLVIVRGAPRLWCWIGGSQCCWAWRVASLRCWACGQKGPVCAGSCGAHPARREGI